MAPSARILAVALLLVVAAGAAEAKWSPLSILTRGVSGKFDKAGASDSGDVCSNTNLYTMPSVAKVHVCSRSVSVSKNGGGATSSATKSSFSIPKVASTACAEAVTDGVKALCVGGDPIATISSMASTCASAVAEMQATTISGAEVKSGTSFPPKDYTRSAYTTACTSGCATGQVSAQAVAQAAACAFAKQTKGCNSVRSALAQQSYSSAFVSTTAKAWSNACALGFGKAHGEGEAVAKTLVSVLSRAFGDIAAKACSECDSCKCKPLPLGIDFDKLRGASDTAAAAADGRYTMARTFANAAATYCASDKSARALRTGVDTTVSTLATMIADVYAKTSGSSTATGQALSCSGGSVTTKIQASKTAIVTAVAEANSVVFAQRCASAYAKLDGMVNMLKDSIEDTFDSVSNACANGAKGPPTVNSQDVVKKALDSNAPLTAAIGGALQDAVSCGCQPGACIWCAPKSKAKNGTLSYDFGKPGAKGNITSPRSIQDITKMLTGLLSR
ncbi:MAG: hypothetical protein J3K34DRAFT_248977 [Monoraphidium minutum]|nr:MAG: hypothetical protein J3K34DRAFT_248977 [Monoraphidium minutum]